MKKLLIPLHESLWVFCDNFPADNLRLTLMIKILLLKLFLIEFMILLNIRNGIYYTEFRLLPLILVDKFIISIERKLWFSFRS